MSDPYEEYRAQLSKMLNDGVITTHQAVEMSTKWMKDNPSSTNTQHNSVPALNDTIEKKLAYTHRKYRNDVDQYNLSLQELRELWLTSHEKCFCCGDHITLNNQAMLDCRDDTRILKRHNSAWLCMLCHKLKSTHTIKRFEQLVAYMKGAALEGWKVPNEKL